VGRRQGERAAGPGAEERFEDLIQTDANDPDFATLRAAETTGVRSARRNSWRISNAGWPADRPPRSRTKPRRAADRGASSTLTESVNIAAVTVFNVAALGRPPSRSHRHVRIAIKTLLLLLSAFSPEVSNNVSVVPQNPQALISQAALDCKYDLSEKAAQVAREKIPDSTDVGFAQIQLSRQQFLRENQWSLFDTKHNKRLDFEGYHDWQWAAFLTAAKPGTCILTKRQFFYIMLNRPTDPINGWLFPSSLQNAAVFWRGFDVTHRGFLVKNDLKNGDLASFSRADVFHRGYLTPEQTF
jgi:hypothetical protein